LFPNFIDDCSFFEIFIKEIAGCLHPEDKNVFRVFVLYKQQIDIYRTLKKRFMHMVRRGELCRFRGSVNPKYCVIITKKFKKI